MVRKENIKRKDVASFFKNDRASIRKDGASRIKREPGWSFKKMGAPSKKK